MTTYLGIKPDELSSGTSTRMLEKSVIHHRYSSLIGRHRELSLLGDLAVVGAGVNTVHDDSITTF